MLADVDGMFQIFSHMFQIFSPVCAHTVWGWAQEDER